MTALLPTVITLCVLIVPFILGSVIAKMLRANDYGTQLGVILTSIAASIAVIYAATLPPKPLTYTVTETDTLQSIAQRFDVPAPVISNENNLQRAEELKPGAQLRISKPKRLEIKRGVDLRGGVILIYEVDEERSLEARESATDNAPANAQAQETTTGVDIPGLVEALGRRINPGGQKEVVIRPYGDRQVEIIIPDVDDAEVERIKRTIVTSGYLKFMILADRDKHPALVATAETQPNARVVRDAQGNPLGEWVPIERNENGELRVTPFPSHVTRELRPGFPEMLMVHDPYNVEGRDLANVSEGHDPKVLGAPAIDFSFGSQGSKLFSGLTSTNIASSLGIVIDGQLLSAATINEMISDRGQITGKFTSEYVKMMVDVLKAGRLPAVLKPEPITENRIDPLLGKDTIQKGTSAILASLALVLSFMLVYYRFAGLVACIALILNLLLTVMFMILMRGTFTLPGLAGLVLTIGMSVDANVLIFERIREERSRGTGLRMAIRNGFQRAMSAIVDSNITTIITGVVLYAIGSDSLRGFAVTLILGILMSMFTAIYCSRAILEVAERCRFIKDLSMVRLLDAPKIDFLKLGPPAIWASLIVIGIGIVGMVSRGASLFDIDFRGGTSVQVRLKEPMEYAALRQRIDGLAEDISLTQVTPRNVPANTVWKIDTSIADNKELEQKLGERLLENERSLLVSHTVTFTDPVPRKASSLPAGSNSVTPPGSTDQSQTPLPPDNVLALANDPRLLAQADVNATNTPQSTTAADPSNASATNASITSSTAGTTGSADNDSKEKVSTSITFGVTGDDKTPQRVTRATLLEALKNAAGKLGTDVPPMDITGPMGERDSAAGFATWKIDAETSTTSLTSLLNELKVDLENEPAWLSSSQIGGRVAGDMKQKAIVAILISLVAIIAYLWLRFHRVEYGIAAAIALLHDVLVTVGAIGVSHWLAGSLGFLKVDEFKISLDVVASLLTIIGYSLNDTIVIFDRIREVKGRSPKLTNDIVNTSVNQTLSRTLLTALTTLIVVVVLYFWGGEGIHGFAFSMMIGVIAGTYSTVFIACPALLAMTRDESVQSRPASKTAAVKA